MSHLDDMDEKCDCDDLECLETDDGGIKCPHCGVEEKFDEDGEPIGEELFDLVCGDHGTKCLKCGGRFTCP